MLVHQFKQHDNTATAPTKWRDLETSRTAWKESKYGVFSGPYFSAFSPDTGKDGPEKTPYLDTFRAVLGFRAGLRQTYLEEQFRKQNEWIRQLTKKVNVLKGCIMEGHF